MLILYLFNVKFIDHSLMNNKIKMGTRKINNLKKTLIFSSNPI
jgi:hypothetical protein